MLITRRKSKIIAWSVGRRLGVALTVAALARMSTLGRSEANGGDIHIGNLSSGASLAVIAAFAVVAALIVAMFMLRWRESVKSSGTRFEDGDNSSDEMEHREEE